MYILIIIILCWVVYWRSLNHSYIVDDIATYRTLSESDGKFSWRVRRSQGWRGVARYIKERLYGGCTLGTNIRHDNILRISLWSLSCVMVYIGLGRDSVAFWAAMLYAVHPANNQLSLWANGRRYVVILILTMAMMAMGPVGILLYPLTMTWHVTAFFSPVLIHPAAILAAPVMYLVCRREIQRKIAARCKLIYDEDRLVWRPRRIIITIKHYGHFFFKMFLPGRCAITYPKLYHWGITSAGNKAAYSPNIEFFAGVVALSFTMAAFIHAPADAKKYVLFFFLSTVQWCAIVPVVQDLGDRYIALPSVMAMWLVSWAAHSVGSVIAVPILLCVMTYYLCFLSGVFSMYRNVGSFWAYHRYHFPSLVAPRKYEISTALKTGDVITAWYLCREGLRYNPSEFILLHQAALCHAQIGELPIALDFARQAKANMYLYQGDVQGPNVDALITGLEAAMPKPSRQVRRAEERKIVDEKKDV